MTALFFIKTMNKQRLEERKNGRKRKSGYTTQNIRRSGLKECNNPEITGVEFLENIYNSL